MMIKEEEEEYNLKGGKGKEEMEVLRGSRGNKRRGRRQ